MPRTTLGGADHGHELTADEKDELERALRKEARDLLKAGKPRERREREDRAKNISRRASKKGHHH